MIKHFNIWCNAMQIQCILCLLLSSQISFTALVPPTGWMVCISGVAELKQTKLNEQTCLTWIKWTFNSPCILRSARRCRVSMSLLLFFPLYVHLSVRSTVNALTTLWVHSNSMQLSLQQPEHVRPVAVIYSGPQSRLDFTEAVTAL